jgi:glycosyltransferase involved in cell wall biosynthesis
MPVKISAVIPTHNGSLFLEETLNGLLLQTSPVHEVIIVDDGSTDNTSQIIEHFTTKLPIKAFYRTHCGNWVSNTNFGLAQAVGDYVSILHQDDVWLPDRVAVLTEILHTHPASNMLLHPSVFIDMNGKRLGIWRCPFGRKQGAIESAEILERLIVQNFISMPAPLISRQALEKIGALDETLWFTADWKLWLSLARLGKWTYHPVPLTCFRVHENSQTIRGGQSIQSYAEQIRRVQEPLLDDFSPQKIQALARFNTETNVALLHILFSQPYPWFGLLSKFITLGPTAWMQFFSFSRFHERLIARLRLRKNLIRTRRSMIESDDSLSRDR